MYKITYWDITEQSWIHMFHDLMRNELNWEADVTCFSNPIRDNLNMDLQVASTELDHGTSAFWLYGWCCTAVTWNRACLLPLIISSASWCLRSVTPNLSFYICLRCFTHGQIKAIAIDLSQVPTFNLHSTITR